MSKKLTTILIGLALLAGGAAWWRYRAVPAKAAFCGICARPIHAGMATEYTVAGQHERACCAACVFTRVRQSGQTATIDLVTDHASGEALAPQRAVFVVGSDEHPCSAHAAMISEATTPAELHYDRCLPSVIAFREAERARAFAREHGGEVQSWDQVKTALGTPGAPAIPREKKP